MIAALKKSQGKVCFACVIQTSHPCILGSASSSKVGMLPQECNKTGNGDYGPRAERLWLCWSDGVGSLSSWVEVSCQSPDRARVPAQPQHTARLGEVNWEGLGRSKCRMEPVLHLCVQMLPLQLIHWVPECLCGVCSSHSITLDSCISQFLPPAPARTATISKISHLSTVSQKSLEEVRERWADITHYFTVSSASLFS